MSISKFQDRLFNKGGCGTAILIGCAMVFGAFAFQNWGRANQTPAQDAQGRPTFVIATIDGTPIESGAIDEAVDNMQKSEADRGGGPDAPPAVHAQQYGDAISQALQLAAIPAVAKSMGVQFTDDQLREAEKARIQQGMEQQRVQAIMSGSLKPTSTDADWSAFVKSSTGKTVQEIQSAQMAEFDANLQDPTKRQQIVAGLGAPMLISALASKVSAPDAAVKASYDQYTFKRILLTEKPPPSPSVAERLATVKKDLAAGTPFEQEMNRYSDETPKPKQTVSQNTQQFTASQLMENPSLSALKSMKIGAVSQPVVGPDGTSIYKLISIKNQAPADFAKKLSDYKKQYQQQMAGAALQDRIDSIVKSDTKWQSPGYEALYDVTRPNIDPKKGQQLYEEAKSAAEKEGFDMREAELAEYMAFNIVWTAPGADKVKLRPERIQVLNDLLTNMENFEVRMELVSLYEADKNAAMAAQSLLAAAGSNNTYDSVGQTRWGDVEESLIKLKSEGLLSADKAKEIEDIQNSWKSDKDSYDKDQAQQAAEKAKEQAEEEADRKKAEAEAKAAEKNAQKNKTGSASKPAGPGLPPTLTPTGKAPAGAASSKGQSLPPGFLPPSGGSKG